jgi:hypothetical protein
MKCLKEPLARLANRQDIVRRVFLIKATSGIAPLRCQVGFARVLGGLLLCLPMPRFGVGDDLILA